MAKKAVKSAVPEKTKSKRKTLSGTQGELDVEVTWKQGDEDVEDDNTLAASETEFSEAQALAEDAEESPEYVATHDESHKESDLGEEESRKRIHIDFAGSEILRAKAPKVFEFAETVAEEWVNDGDFQALPVGHPIAQLALAEGLKRAKKVEKKLEEKGVFLVAKMGVDYLKTKMRR